MQAKEVILLPTTYQQALDHLKNGKHFFGIEMSDELSEAYNETSHPLVFILENYIGAKATLMEMGCKLNQEFLDAIKQTNPITLLIIEDAIKTLSVEELLKIRIDTGRMNKSSILCFLADTGADEIFSKVFNKLKDHLSFKELEQIIERTSQAYEGGAEGLHLASSLLDRGDVCFVRILKAIIEPFMQENKFVDLLKNSSGDKTIDLNEILSNRKKRLISGSEPRYSESKYIDMSWKYSNSDEEYDAVEKEAKDRYKRFVLDHNGVNLLDQLMCDLLQVQIILDKLIDLKTKKVDSEQKKSEGLDCIKQEITLLTPESAAILKSMLKGDDFSFLNSTPQGLTGALQYIGLYKCDYYGRSNTFSSIMKELDAIIQNTDSSEVISKTLK